MTRYRVDVGSEHGVQKGDIVGAVANEADIESRYIGKITLGTDHSFIELPEGMPKATFKKLRKVWVRGKQLNITEASPPKP